MGSAIHERLVKKKRFATVGAPSNRCEKIAGLHESNPKMPMTLKNSDDDAWKAVKGT